MLGERSREMAVSSAGKPRRSLTEPLFVRAKSMFHVKHFQKSGRSTRFGG
jgi:hypothetical protein